MEKIKQLFEDSKTRILTGVVLLLLVAFVIYLDSTFLTWAILGAIYLLGFSEALNLLGVVKNKNKYIYISVAIWIVCGLFSSPLIVGLSFLIFVVAYMLQTQRINEKALISLIYPTLPMLMIYELYAYFGMTYLLWLIIIVAVTDTGAYVIGKMVGKTSFSVFSPNKTWEGVAGGVFIGTILGSMVGIVLYDCLTSFIVSLFVSVASIYGDLFESYLKRKAGVKDSGTLMPGHGGILDRLDGYLFGVVAMMLLLEGLV